jgi:hypothetical protein
VAVAVVVMVIVVVAVNPVAAAGSAAGSAVGDRLGEGAYRSPTQATGAAFACLPQIGCGNDVSNR